MVLVKAECRGQDSTSVISGIGSFGVISHIVCTVSLAKNAPL